ncbi:hypothetical protein GCM10028824_26490 [Hymenobacter segetis]|uniref:Uncharacterized protein n=1 Tax=Hymenobacter segetis TaxID=2025509 RepID=A0ABU9LVV0_9BACT
MQDPKTDTWHDVRRDNSTDPPELPDRDQVLLTTAETDEALYTMQQRVCSASSVSAQRAAAERATRELPKMPWDAGALARWAWAKGQQLTAHLMPPL